MPRRIQAPVVTRLALLLLLLAQPVRANAQIDAQAAAEQALFSFGGDLRDFPARVWRNVRSMPTLNHIGILALAGGLAGASHEYWDEDVADWTARHPRRFGHRENHFFDNAGESFKQLAAAGALYGTSLLLRSGRLHEFSLDSLHALAIEIPALYGLKRAFNTRRPNGASNGFPSGHVASSFAVAAVLHENYGWLPGIAGYTLAGFVGFHRIDARRHDLSDVIFAAALGYVIGSSAAANTTPTIAGFRVMPFADELSGAPGLCLERRF